MAGLNACSGGHSAACLGHYTPALSWQRLQPRRACERFDRFVPDRSTSATPASLALKCSACLAAGLSPCVIARPANRKLLGGKARHVLRFY